jgi:hypothetical protein
MSREHSDHHDPLPRRRNQKREIQVPSSARRRGDLGVIVALVIGFFGWIALGRPSVRRKKAGQEEGPLGVRQ